MSEEKLNLERKLVLEWFLDENNINKSFDLSRFCLEKNIDEKGREKITRFFSRMRNNFDKEQSKLELDGKLEGNEFDKFEKVKKTLKEQSPPLFYIIWTGRDWIIPTYEQKFNNNSKLGNRYIKAASKHLEEMIKNSEYILTSPEFKSKEPNELVNDVRVFKNVILLYQKMVEHYDNRIYFLAQNPNELNPLREFSPISDDINEFKKDGIWSITKKMR